MALLRSTTKLLAHARPKLIARTITTTSPKLSSDDPLHCIGPWPRTKEERERAAKKYNLIPEDYQPFEEDEARGDYPDIPAVGQYNRDEYEDFDDINDRRNYGEPLHLDWDLYMYHRIDPFNHLRPDNPVWFKWTFFFCMLGFAPFLMFLDSHFDLHINHPWKQRLVTGKQQLYEFPPGTTMPKSHH